MSYNNVRVVGAASVPREDIITPFKEVLWKIPGWQGGPVIYSDNGSIFIYDFDFRALHVFVDWSYLSHPMVDVKIFGEPGYQMVHTKIQLTSPDHMTVANEMDQSLKDHILEMVSDDPETIERLQMLH